MFHFASIWMFGNLPEGEILEQNKMVINSITSIVDSRGFFFCFSSKIRCHNQNAYLAENKKQ